MNEFGYLRQLGDEVERLRKLDALLPEICQLLDTAREDFMQRGLWTEWDQSVRDRVTAYNLSRRNAGVSLLHSDTNDHQTPQKDRKC